MGPSAFNGRELARKVNVSNFEPYVVLIDIGLEDVTSRG
jgi:hypothetical protein